jgi:hypothetical protein
MPAEAKWLPIPQTLIDIEMQSLPGVQASLMATGRVVTARMKANVSGPRVAPFRKRSFTKRSPEDKFVVVAGTTWKLAHLFEFGSQFTRPHGWLRSAAIGLPGTRFWPGAGPSA